MSRRGLIRGAALIASLVVTMSACQLDITIGTTVNRDGSGHFSLQFFVDKDLIDLARNSGQDTFTTLCNIPQELSRKGWDVQRSTEGGGLRISLGKSFSGPADLDDALNDLRACLSSRTGSKALFFDMKLDRSSSFLRTGNALQGSVDLTSGGLVAQTNLSAETQARLQTFIEQAGSQFFDFTVTMSLPGKIASTEGDPTEVSGGTVRWSPQLGKKLEFRASSTAYNLIALAAVGIPLLVLLGFVAWWLARRRPGSEPESKVVEPVPVDGRPADAD